MKMDSREALPSTKHGTPERCSPSSTQQLSPSVHNNTSILETSDEDNPNIAGFSRKRMLLNQYRKEQYLHGDESVDVTEKSQVGQNSRAKEEEIQGSDSCSSNERYAFEPASSPESENARNLEDKVEVEISILNPASSHQEENMAFVQHDDPDEDDPREGTSRDNISPPTESCTKSKKPNPLISDTKKCQVCMSPAAKHVHYGATTFFSCRAFFRRSIQTSQSRNYVCRREANCKILPDTRKGCQKCRLETCLRIGMKPGWVLNTDERARRFRKLRMKKAEQSKTKHPQELESNLIQHPEKTENDNNLRRRLSPSPTAYSKRRQQNFLIEDDIDREQDNGTNHPYKRMYLQLRDGREVLDEAMEKEHTSNFADVTDLEEYRDRHMRPQVEQSIIKLEPDQVISRTELLYPARNEIIEERRKIPRLVEAYPCRSRSQCRDDIVEKSVAFLRDEPAEFTETKNDPHGRKSLGHARSTLSSSAKTNILVDDDEKDLVCTFSTFKPSSSATMTSSNFRECLSSNRPEYNREQISHRSTATSGCIDELDHPSSRYSSFQGTSNDIRLPQQQSHLRESPPVSSKSPPPLLYRGKEVLTIDDRMEWNNGYHDPNTFYSETEENSTLSSHVRQGRRPMYSRSSPEQRGTLEPISTRALSLTSRLERMFVGPGEDEINVVNDIVNQHDKHYKSVNFGEDLIKEMIMSSIFGIPMSANTALSAYRLMIQRVTRVSKHFDDFTNLSGKVQGVLLKRNADLVVSLRGSAFFQMKTGLDQILTSLGLEDIETAKNMILTTLKSNSTKEEDYKKIDYKKFNTIQKTADQTAAETRYGVLLSQIGSAVAFNQNLIKLLSYVLMFCSDFTDDDIDLEERTSIEKAQKNLIHIVQRYVFATYPEPMASSVFSGMMECLGSLRELVFIKSKRGNIQESKEKANPSSTLVH